MVNRKGFISTATIYTFFLVFCMLLILIMTTYINNRVNFKMIKNDVKNYIYEIDKNNIDDSDDIDDTLNGWELILNNNGGATLIETKGTPDFSTTATTNEGMYAATDDLGTSYYFRGAVDNNWVKFGKYSEDYIIYKGYKSLSPSSKYIEYKTLDECNSASEYNKNCTEYKVGSKGDDIYWRIIRINGDGSIRMIYSGTTTPDSGTATVMTGEGTQISSKCSYNYHFGGADHYYHIGYMYTPEEEHGTSTSSDIKTKIDEWYENTTLSDDKTKSLIADQIFCNDRSIRNRPTKQGREYGAYWRLNNKEKNIKISPALTCSEASDKFTVNASNGNGALDYPVGLITADEVAMAGGVYDTTNSSYYLYTSLSYFTGTPFESYVEENNYIFVVKDNLIITMTGNTSEYGYGVRPVISLSSDVKLSGKGTYDDVYTVEIESQKENQCKKEYKLE